MTEFYIYYADPFNDTLVLTGFRSHQTTEDHLNEYQFSTCTLIGMGVLPLLFPTLEQAEATVEMMLDPMPLMLMQESGGMISIGEFISIKALQQNDEKNIIQYLPPKKETISVMTFDANGISIDVYGQRSFQRIATFRWMGTIARGAVYIAQSTDTEFLIERFQLSSKTAPFPGQVEEFWATTGELITVKLNEIIRIDETPYGNRAGG